MSKLSKYLYFFQEKKKRKRETKCKENISISKDLMEFAKTLTPL
jgi:hypothetical protein